MSSIDRDEAQHFFVRLWYSDDLIDELVGEYDKVEADLRTLVPLKRVCTLAAPDEASALHGRLRSCASAPR